MTSVSAEACVGTEAVAVEICEDVVAFSAVKVRGVVGDSCIIEALDVVTADRVAGILAEACRGVANLGVVEALGLVTECNGVKEVSVLCVVEPCVMIGVVAVSLVVNALDSAKSFIVEP